MNIDEYKKLLDAPNKSVHYVKIDWNVKGFRKKLRRWLRKWHRPYSSKLKVYIRKHKQKDKKII